LGKNGGSGGSAVTSRSVPVTSCGIASSRSTRRLTSRRTAAATIANGRWARVAPTCAPPLPKPSSTFATASENRPLNARLSGAQAASTQHRSFVAVNCHGCRVTAPAWQTSSRSSTRGPSK
jgi:hypothetical protein